MAKSTLSLRERENLLRDSVMNFIAPLLKAEFDECLQTTGELLIPLVDDNDDEKWCKIIFQIPRKSRNGVDFDGYTYVEEKEGL